MTAPNQATAAQNIHSLMTNLQQLGGQMTAVIQDVSTHAGKYYVYIKENDRLLTNGALLLSGIPLIYNNWGSVAIGIACVKIAPGFLPQMLEKVQFYWNDTDTAKFVLCAGGGMVACFAPTAPAAFAYGAYVGTKVLAVKAKPLEEQKPVDGYMASLWNYAFGAKQHPG